MEPNWTSGASYMANISRADSGQELMNQLPHASKRSRLRTAWLIFSAVFLCFCGAVFAFAGWLELAGGGDPWGVAAALSFALLCFAAPAVGDHIRDRPDKILCPQNVVIDGEPVVHFPGDRKAVPVSSVLYILMAGAVGSLGMASESAEVRWILVGVAVVFLTYPLFAVAGRFNEDGTFLTTEGLTVRARGLRAELPWASIDRAFTFQPGRRRQPRTAIYLHPGSPRTVRLTTPWWIGAPYPRRDLVYISRVQVPGMTGHDIRTDPGVWINDFAQRPPTQDELRTDYPPSEPEPIGRSRIKNRLRRAPWTFPE